MSAFGQPLLFSRRIFASEFCISSRTQKPEKGARDAGVLTDPRA